MPASNSVMIHKLQVALNSRGWKILLNRSQFYSDIQNRPVTIYKVSQSVWNPEIQRYNHHELFSSASEIQIVLFLRNLWYIEIGKPIPPTNHMKGAKEFEKQWEEFYTQYKENLSNNQK